MTRSEVREAVFKLLFRTEFHDDAEYDEQIKLFVEQEDIERPADFIEESDYITEKVNAIREKLPEIDSLIDEKSEGWKTTRMGKVDLTIIRLAIYEIKYEDSIPDKVAINEAVNLAKEYGTDNSGSFVNGILAKVYD
ncbi:MAG: transcription antitermination factor NusB [Lachnospiraceae bacterium]|nr:transcription antitermination factor NusB [Lachnospiraceae bacterium]